jgi:hypothetical protein
MSASNLAAEVKSLVQTLSGNAQLLMHTVLIFVGLILLVQELNWISFTIIPGSFQTWIYAAGFAYLIRR